MHKIFWQWAGVFILAFVGLGADMIPTIESWVPSIVCWSIALLWLIATILYWRVHKIEIYARDNKTRMGRQSEIRLLERLDSILDTIEYEYNRLGDIAVKYPLNHYEKRFLLPISGYNRLGDFDSKEEKIVRSLMYIYNGKINPYLLELENTSSLLKELYNIKQHMRDDKLSKSLDILPNILQNIQSVRIMYGLLEQHCAIMTTKDIDIYQKCEEIARKKLTNTKRLIYKRIRHLIRWERIKLYIW